MHDHVPAGASVARLVYYNPLKPNPDPDPNPGPDPNPDPDLNPSPNPNQDEHCAILGAHAVGLLTEPAQSRLA